MRSMAMIEVDSIEAVKGQGLLPLVTAPHRDAFALLTQEVFDGRPGFLEIEIVGHRGTRRRCGEKPDWRGIRSISAGGSPATFCVQSLASSWLRYGSAQVAWRVA